MAALVLDASVIVAVAVPDESDPRASDAVGLMVEYGALVPSHWLLEIGNALLMAERRKRISTATRNKALSYVASLPFEIDELLRDVVWSAVMELASIHRLTLYDSAYLELAARAGLPFATLDDKLAEAARKESILIVGRV